MIEYFNTSIYFKNFYTYIIFLVHPGKKAFKDIIQLTPGILNQILTYLKPNYLFISKMFCLSFFIYLVQLIIYWKRKVPFTCRDTTKILSVTDQSTCDNAISATYGACDFYLLSANCLQNKLLMGQKVIWNLR